MNTTSSRGWRDKYRSATMQRVLRNALVTEAICEVDRSDNYRVQNPYSNQPTATLTDIDGGSGGTYTVSAWTQTDDTLTVTDEVIYAEHIFDFERVMNNYDLFATRTEELAYAVANRIDYFVLNSLTDVATGTYTTAAGGFTTASNVNKIFADLIGKVSGYTEVYKGLYLVVENTDIPGIIQAQANSGFSYADSALRNGFMTSHMGVDIYVVRTGTFATASIGTLTAVNSGHRVFGVKNVSTYLNPRNIRFEEKQVTLKTGVEFVTYGYIGHKLWNSKTALTVDITLA